MQTNHRIICEFVLKRLAFILTSVMLLCTACEFKLKTNEDAEDTARLEVQRYDRLQARYLTTGDFAALQQMNTDFPIETRTLIEDILHLGEINDPNINARFLSFYQDTLLQSIIKDVEIQYANIDDINNELSTAFEKFSRWYPNTHIPTIYTQIGSLDQSIIIQEKQIGISLDKYLGNNYPIYKKFDYSEQQLATMKREYVVPDCLTFYLLSIFPLNDFEHSEQQVRDIHMGKILWVVNKMIGRTAYSSEFVSAVNKYMLSHPQMTIPQLLEKDDYSDMMP